MDDNAYVCPSCGAPAGNSNQKPQGNGVFNQQPQYNGNNMYGQSYNQNGYGQRPPMNGLAIAGMVVGIVGLFLSFWGIIPIVATVLSAFAMKQINQTGVRGKGMAIAGLVMGIIGIVWAVITIAICTTAVNSYNSTFNRFM